jgi:hypothetical protein
VVAPVEWSGQGAKEKKRKEKKRKEKKRKEKKRKEKKRKEKKGNYLAASGTPKILAVVAPVE